MFLYFIQYFFCQTFREYVLLAFVVEKKCSSVEMVFVTIFTILKSAAEVGVYITRLTEIQFVIVLLGNIHSHQRKTIAFLYLPKVQ
jgi:hypothetical protein